MKIIKTRLLNKDGSEFFAHNLFIYTEK